LLSHVHRGEKVQLLVFWDWSRNGCHLINYRHCLRSLRNVIKSVQHIFCESPFVNYNKGKYFTLNSLSYHFSPFENENYHRFIISLQANNLTSLSPYATDLTRKHEDCSCMIPYKLHTMPSKESIRLQWANTLNRKCLPKQVFEIKVNISL
jgi:hypothetical protein